MTEYEFPTITPDMTQEQLAQAEQEAEALLFRHNQIYGSDEADNDIDEKAENTGNPNHDKLGKFATGGGASGVMGEQAAIEAIKDSKYKEPLYHGTFEPAAKAISEDGFKVNKQASAEANRYGKGVYLTSNREYTSYYGDKRIKTYLDTKNPYISDDSKLFDKNKNWVADSVQGKALAYGIKKGYYKEGTTFPDFTKDRESWYKSLNGAAEGLFKQGHDAIILKMSDETMVIVPDPSKIKIASVGDN